MREYGKEDKPEEKKTIFTGNFILKLIGVIIAVIVIVGVVLPAIIPTMISGTVIEVSVSSVFIPYEWEEFYYEYVNCQYRYDPITKTTKRQCDKLKIITAHGTLMREQKTWDLTILLTNGTIIQAEYIRIAEKVKAEGYGYCVTVIEVEDEITASGYWLDNGIFYISNL